MDFAIKVLKKKLDNLLSMKCYTEKDYEIRDGKVDELVKAIKYLSKLDVQ